uniref:Uncharacterized protein n=1 Tax=Octopus bimaculoides TaxID=37653 RepID=A0A0L8ICC0_OCTBM
MARQKALRLVGLFASCSFIIIIIIIIIIITIIIIIIIISSSLYVYISSIFLL